MRSIHSKKRYLAMLTAMMMIFSLFSFSVNDTIIAKAAGEEAILDLDNSNQNPVINFSALKNSEGKMIISNDAATGGFVSTGISNTSYLLTPGKVSGDFTVEAKLKVLNRTISGTTGAVAVGAFSGTGDQDAFVSTSARGDKGARSYYKKSSGSFGAGSPNLASTTDIGQSVYLKIERSSGKYTSTVNAESKELSGLALTETEELYLGIAICGTKAEVESFIIKQGNEIMYDLSKPSLPRPSVTAEANGGDINISWTSVEEAASYALEYKAYGSLTWTTGSSNIEGLNYKLSELTAMTPYYFRVKVKGGASNNLYSAPVMAIPGFNWSSVTKPSITGTGLSEDGAEVLVNYSMVMGALGATNIDIQMLKGNTVIDTKSVAEAVSVLGKDSGCVRFRPTESGTYSFKASALRNGEADIKESDTINLEFDLPVGKPVASTTAAATGAIKVLWEAVKEAESYKVEYKKEGDSDFLTAASSTKELSCTIAELIVGTTYEFKVTAYKGEKSAVSDIVKAKVKEIIGEVVEWKTVIFGQSVSETSNTIQVDNVNDTVTLASGVKDGSAIGGKVTGSHDGISYYYTEVDPTKNFEVSAKVKVNFFAKETPDKQEAFGIMARDAIGNNYDSTIFASNMVMVGGYRGLLQSVFRNNVKDISGAGAAMEDVFQFGERPANDGTASYKLTMKKTNTGYHVCVDDGEEKIYYRPKQLEIIDSGKVYVGFFTARVASITVSEITIKTSDVATDPAAVPEPPKPVDPVVSVLSRTGTSNASYDLKLSANVKGTVVIKQENTEIFSDNIDANNEVIKNTTLVAGNNVFDITFTPASDAIVTSKDPVNVKHAVTYKSYGAPGGSVYVSPEGTAEADGTESSPIDIESAIKFVNDGQTIYVRGGLYSLMHTLTIEEGNDGTGNRPKVLTAYPNETPIFDFGNKGSGVVLAADCWKIYGIDIARSAYKGLQITGSYNVVERVNAYENLETGIQISAIVATVSKDKWPQNNLVLNCTAFDNKDASENNADGFAAKITVGEGNVFRGCIAYYNCDDGWDLYSKLESGPISPVIVENCVAYSNGYVKGVRTKGDGNGFKLGGEGLPVKHVLRNSLAFRNFTTGITSNSDPAIIVENVTSVDNGSANFSFNNYATSVPQFTAKNNISFRTVKGTADQYPTELISEDNYFYNGERSGNSSGKEVVAADFKSVTSPEAVGRNSDGTINIGDYMVLAANTAITGGGKLLDFSKITTPASKPGSGTDNGGSDNGGGNNGGTDNDGTNNGGTDNGGTNNGGTDNGDVNNDGSNNTGTGNGNTNNNGGTNNGGNSNEGTNNEGTKDQGNSNGETSNGGVNNGENANDEASNGGTDSSGTANEGTDSLPKTGSPINLGMIVITGIALEVLGCTLVLSNKRKRRD